MVDSLEGGVRGHDGLDEQDADKGADPSEEPYLNVQRHVAEPAEGWEGKGRVRRQRLGIAVACEARDPWREVSAVVAAELQAVQEGMPGGAAGWRMMGYIVVGLSVVTMAGPVGASFHISEGHD